MPIPSPFDLSGGRPEGAHATSSDDGIGFRVGLHDQSLDDYDDEPVYRSLGACLGFEDGADISEAQEVGHEPPTYRGLGAMDDSMIESEDDADAMWLASMPPLVQRQRAGTLDLGFDGFN